ncbi:MAG: hypothetical protein R3B84_06155 [Zavarzinella sp.]
MIERPKRSVTRFFVPLIDVLILLFCIFLLMPFVEDPNIKGKSKESQNVDIDFKLRAAQQEIKSLEAGLQAANEKIARMLREQKNVAERLHVKVLEIDPENGRLYYLQNNQREYITTQAEAEDVITLHSRSAPSKEPFFLILYPRQRSGFPEQRQADTYARWFNGVQYQFDRPGAPQP